MILVPLSASVERFSVSCMRDFSRGYGIFHGPMEKSRRSHKRYLHGFFQGIWNFPGPHGKNQEVTGTLLPWFFPGGMEFSRAPWKKPGGNINVICMVFSRGYGIFQGFMEKTRRLHKRYYHGFFQGVWNFPGPHGKKPGGLLISLWTRGALLAATSPTVRSLQIFADHKYVTGRVGAGGRRRHLHSQNFMFGVI